MDRDSEIPTSDTSCSAATMSADLDFQHHCDSSDANFDCNNAIDDNFVDLDSLGTDDTSLSEHQNIQLLGNQQHSGMDWQFTETHTTVAAAFRHSYDNENDCDEEDEKQLHAMRQLRDLVRLQKREMYKLATELQESILRRQELSKLLSCKDEELRKLRHELLLREIWCRQLAEETEQESARSGRLLRRCQELQEQQQCLQAGGACARCGYAGGVGGGGGFASRATSTRLGRFSSTTIWRTPPQQLLPSQAPQPAPPVTQQQQPQQQQQQTRSAKKLSSLLTGRYSFRLRKRRSSSSATSSSTATTASAGSAAVVPVRLESNV